MSHRGFSRRSLLALVLSVGLIPLVMPLAACLHVPVGDPEVSSVDKALSGAWSYRGNDGQEQLYIVRPYDKRTYYVQSFLYKGPGVFETDASISYKAWLTQLGGATFITMEPLSHKQALGLDGEAREKFWLVGRLTINESSVELRPISTDSGFIKKGEPAEREAVEKIIAANVDNDQLYGETVRLIRADPEHIKEVLAAFKVD